MDKLAISTEVNLTLNFFTAVGRDNYKEAFRLFNSASLGPTIMQSLKAKFFVDSGEWEYKDKLQIRLITGSHCNGQIGSTLISPSGVDFFSRKTPAQ